MKQARVQKSAWLTSLVGAWFFVLALSVVHPAVASDAISYYYTDVQGSVLAVTDAQGNIVSQAERKPYGEQAVGMPEPGPGYTGHVEDIDSGFVYMQARYYDPTTARFLSVDPVAPTAGDAFNVNRYAYASNNPVVNIDPDGRETGIAYHAEFVMMGGKAQTYSSPNDPVGEGIQAAFGMLPVIGDGVNIANALGDPSAVNISAAVVGIVPVVGGAAAEGIRGAAAVDRAGAIAGTMSARTQRSVTIAVTETKEGTRVVSSSEGMLRPAARAALGEGEVAAKGVAGTHAEVNGINAAREMGLTPTGSAASRPICPSCAQAMEQEGVKPLSPLKQ